MRAKQIVSVGEVPENLLGQDPTEIEVLLLRVRAKIARRESGLQSRLFFATPDKEHEEFLPEAA